MIFEGVEDDFCGIEDGGSWSEDGGDAFFFEELVVFFWDDSAAYDENIVCILCVEFAYEFGNEGGMSCGLRRNADDVYIAIDGLLSGFLGCLE